jgi:hypothetical protein
MKVRLANEFIDLRDASSQHQHVRTSHAAWAEGSIRFVGGSPHVLEDGVIERSDLRISALNDRAAELGKQESSKGKWIMTGTLADPKQ